MTSLAPCFGQETDQTRFDAPEPAKPIEIQCLCPFCGAFNTGVGKPCAHCEMEDTTATRDATRQRAGQWFVLQPNSPTGSGMNFESLLAMARRQIVIARTVVRGPTTGQLWRLASKVRGLSREFGHCYACGGDIDTDETVCPHCDRVQTVPDHSEPVAPVAPAAERQALLHEPKITVHSIAGHIDANVDPIAAARPVVAVSERFEHRIPKDDLLTPRDLAKAFQLEFGMPEATHRYLQPNQLIRQIKVGLTSVAALAVAFALVWPLINVVPGWINTNATKSTTPMAALQPGAQNSTLLADAQVAGDKIYVPPTPAIPVALTAPAAPAIVAEPNPGVAPEDDPTLLWLAGINAESSHDYAGAVAAYERIESLPSTAWPAQLESRLSIVRKQLKSHTN